MDWCAQSVNLIDLIQILWSYIKGSINLKMGNKTFRALVSDRDFHITAFFEALIVIHLSNIYITLHYINIYIAPIKLSALQYAQYTVNA